MEELVGRGRGGSLCKSLWAHAGEAVLPAFTWTAHSHPPCLPAGQGEKECLRAVSLGNRLWERDFQVGSFLGIALRICPCGTMSEAGWGRGRIWTGTAVTKASAHPQQGWSLKRVWAFICTPCSPSPSLPTSHGMWTVPWQGGSLQLRAILEKDSAVNRLLPTRPGAERMSLQW